MGETGGEAFGLFVSCVEGRPVTRFGSKILIGADRDPSQPNKIVYRPKDIVGIPTLEVARYGREYRRLIDEGDLVSHDAKAWSAQNEQRSEKHEAREKLNRAEHRAEGER